jgi:hypothetical protein
MRGGDAGGGPDYGAKHVLRVFHAATIATSSTNALIGSFTIPAVATGVPSEDWYVTDWDAFAVGAGSAAAVLTLLSGAAALQAGKTLTLSAGADVAATFTPDSGEEEGTKVVAGTVLSVQATCGSTTAASEVVVHITGYRRFPSGFKAI